MKKSFLALTLIAASILQISLTASADSGSILQDLQKNESVSASRKTCSAYEAKRQELLSQVNQLEDLEGQLKGAQSIHAVSKIIRNAGVVAIPVGATLLAISLRGESELESAMNHSAQQEVSGQLAILIGGITAFGGEAVAAGTNDQIASLKGLLSQANHDAQLAVTKLEALCQ